MACREADFQKLVDEFVKTGKEFSIKGFCNPKSLDWAEFNKEFLVEKIGIPTNALLFSCTVCDRFWYQLPGEDGQVRD